MKKIKMEKFLKKSLQREAFCCILIKSGRYGSLVKRLRRRPLTAETGVRFPYELRLFLIKTAQPRRALRTCRRAGSRCFFCCAFIKR